VQARSEDGELVVVVADHGEGMRPRPDSPGLGLGLPIIATLVTRLDIVNTSTGTEVHMSFPCPAAS
jgi:serine/threonine-protein kinase RsbW/stage II sporulation protein AB (anti-sigma F factor)